MKVERLVLETLERTVWKTGVEIYDEIFEKHQKDPAMGSIYSALDRLERGGFAESRRRQVDPEQLRRRGGRQAREFSLTESGLRKRVEDGAREKGFGLAGVLSPA